MTKGKRIDVVRNSLWTEEELLRRLPEINQIEDEGLKAGVIRTFLYGCPDYFWERPSSSSGKYHSIDERGEYGNWLHTKRVFAEFCNLAESWVKLGVITEQQVEEGKAAALIHDMMKYGWPSEQNEHTIQNHDLVAAEVARDIGGLPEEVCEIIERHMGPWGKGPDPEDGIALLLHTADKSAARASNDIGVLDPADEIREEWPEVTVEGEYDE